MDKLVHIKSIIIFSIQHIFFTPFHFTQYNSNPQKSTEILYAISKISVTKCQLIENFRSIT